MKQLKRLIESLSWPAVIIVATFISFSLTLLKQQGAVDTTDIIPQVHLHKKQQGAFLAIWVSPEPSAYFWHKKWRYADGMLEVIYSLRWTQVLIKQSSSVLQNHSITAEICQLDGEQLLVRQKAVQYSSPFL